MKPVFARIFRIKSICKVENLGNNLLCCVLCNSLQTGLLGVKFNDIGLLKNDFHDVISYAEKIKGLGEPVEWLPYRIGMYE